MKMPPKLLKPLLKNNQSLKQTAIQLNLLTEAEFDEIVRPEQMVAPK